MVSPNDEARAWQEAYDKVFREHQKSEQENLRLQKILRKAIAFKITEGRLPITVEHRGDNAWVVCDPGFVLNRDGEFESEPLPSNRDDEFIARTRFTFKEAWELAEKVAKER